MNFWQFASQHWFIALAMVWVIAAYAFYIANRIVRHLNIRKHGYPPPHCDADGDGVCSCESQKDDA